MSKYEVIFRDRETGDRISIMVEAASFAAAEHKAMTEYDGLQAHDELIQIKKDYE